jgi:DNA-binding winged helix-turn-helix (wHTH) protein/tetratricopeptide (TPR) repeat protein
LLTIARWRRKGPQAAVIYRFGNYELDDAARELRGADGRIDTEPKAFELLLYLVQHRDRAVSKDELLEVLWPRSIVTETALTRCVMKARRAVGDDSDTQSAIRTVHGHGYRFIADLVPGRPPEAGPGEVVDVAVATPPALRRARWLFGGLIAVLAVVAVGLYLRSGEPQLENAGALAVLPVTNLVDDPDLAWVRVGLMSLIKRMLEDGGVEVVAEKSVLNAVGDAPLATPPDDELFTKIREQSGAGSVLHTTLDSQGGLHRLSAVLTSPDGRKLRRMIVGDSPAELAAEMAQVMAGILSGAAIRPANRFSKVSTDPFVNEMYARALDLELQGELEDARELFHVASELEPELFWLRYEMALCTRDLREWDEADRQFESLYEEARSGADARALIVTLNSHGIMELNRNDYEQAESLFRQALGAAAERGYASDRATIHINLALITRRRGDIQGSKQHYEAALAALDEAGEEPSPNFDNNYAGLLMELGDLEQAQRYSERAIEGFRLQGQRRFEAPSLNRLAKILRRRGDFDAAIARHEQALAIYQELGITGGEISVMSALTSLYREKGDLTRAQLNASEVNDRAAATDDELLKADAWMQSAYVDADLGNHADAVADFERAREIFADIGDAAGLRAADTGIAQSCLELGDSDRAAAIAASLLRSALADGNESAEARARWLAGQIAGKSGDMPAAMQAYETVLAYARESGDQAMLAAAGTSLARMQLEHGEVDAAAALTEEVREAAASQFDFQRLDARLAIARGDNARAGVILAALRTRAGEAWNEGDDALLKSLQD